MIDMQVLEKIGIFGTLIFLIWKQFEKKDTQQNNQNDLLVQNLMKSNDRKDEMLERAVNKFELTVEKLTGSITNMDTRLGNIEKSINENCKEK